MMRSELSPFPYHGPLEPDEVTGREELVRDLTDRLSERRVTALLGPRRYGKTSVLRKVCADLAGVGQETVWIDLYELSSVADLAGAIDQGLAKVQGHMRRAIDSFAGALSLRLGLVGVELSKGRRDRPDPVLTVRSLLEVLVRTAEKHPMIVVFDEFSGIANVNHGAAMLRTQLQHHYRTLGIVFAGSQPSTMRMLFTDHAQPFFAQADLVEIGPLAADAVTMIVQDGFEATGRSPGGMTSALVRAAEGHPQRAMQLADALWRYTPEGGAADEAGWVDAVQDVRANVDGGMERLFALLPVGHQKALRAIAADGRVFGRTAEVLELSPGTAAAAVDSLTGGGHLAKHGDRLVIIDPLFSDWIRRRFPVPS
ncbi:MAG TPA: hypothetical protein VFP09_02300 [Desertimonas sp.]|nr:hypothetical protein [Desertimonas sp.]